MVERLIVRPMRHQRDGIGFGGDIPTIFVAVIGKKANAELLYQCGLSFLSKMNHRWRDKVRHYAVDVQSHGHGTTI
jgi:hypothetical protein